MAQRGMEERKRKVEDLEVVFGDVFRGRSVLVTGHTGFKGSWLAYWLMRLGANVTGVSLAPTTKRGLFSKVSLSQHIAHNEIDVRDLTALQRVFEISQPEIVMHLAAQSLVRESYRSPKETFDTNVGGTVNVLECVRLIPSVAAAVIVTSDKCYDNREWVYAYRENDPLGGHDPYSASKGAAEIAAHSYRVSFGHDRPVGIASARAGNVIGGGDWCFDRLIPDCVRALSANEPILIRNPSHLRPWQHVLDPIAGYLTLAVHLLKAPQQFGEAFNFGPSHLEQTNVGELANMFVNAWGHGSLQPVTSDATSPHEAHLLALSCEKAAQKLQWKPVITIEQAVKLTADWYRAELNNEDLIALTNKQIASYTSRAKKQRIVWADAEA